MSNMIDGQHLQSFLGRIEKLEEEKKAIADDIKDVYSEAKGTGFDPAIIKKVIALRKMDKSKRDEQEAMEAMLDMYLSALGDLAGTPLADAAICREFAR